MDDSPVDQLQEALDASFADIAARIYALSPEHRVEAVNRLESYLARVTGTRYDLLHTAWLTTPPADDVVGRLHDSNHTTRRRALAQVRYAGELERYRLIGQALRDGRLSTEQAAAIVEQLRRVHLGTAHLEQAQEWLIERADQFDPDQLRRYTAGILEILDPEAAEAHQARRLEQRERLAHANRSVTITTDTDGTVHVVGRLTAIVGATLAAQLDALTPSAASYAHTAFPPSRPARRADALERLLEICANSGDLPSQHGEPPRAIITLDYATLVSGIGTATLTGSDTQITASAARSIACHADLIPVVLGGTSQPLDLGRTHRLFTPKIRVALAHRDKGCIFPGCDAPPSMCHAHHVVPWWAGGRTDLDNAVLLCPYHHRLVEPDPRTPPEHQWLVRINPTDHLPELIPPITVDPDRRPRRHRRHRPPPCLAAPPSPTVPEPSRSRPSPAWV